MTGSSLRGPELLQWIRLPALALAADGTILGVTPECQEQAGDAPSELLGRTCSQVVHQHGRLGACDARTCLAITHLALGHAADLSECPLPVAVVGDPATAVVAVSVPPADRGDDLAAVVLLQPQPVSLAGEPRAADSTRATSLGIRLLGAVEVVRGGAPCPVPRRRARELLALLALAGSRGLGRQEISELLWPSSTREAGRGHLRVLLHSIRHSVSEELIDDLGRLPGGDARLRLHPAVWTDIQAFEQVRIPWPRATQASLERRRRRLLAIRRCIGYYRGDLDAAGEFGRWVVPYRQRLRTQYLTLLREAIPLAASLDDFATAIDCSRRAVAAAPLDEGLRLALVALYGHQGRADEAHAEYEAYERLLAEDAERRASRRRQADG